MGQVFLPCCAITCDCELAFCCCCFIVPWSNKEIGKKDFVSEISFSCGWVLFVCLFVMRKKKSVLGQMLSSTKNKTF